MIRHLRHDEIDHAAWDGYLGRCSNRLWYARGRVLDRAAPGWDALIDEEAGAIMPLTWRRKWGVHYLYNPYGLQQLGVFAPSIDDRLTAAFIRAVPPRFLYADIWLNAWMQAVPEAPGRFETQTNQTLIADQDIARLRGGYAKGHIRNLRKATTPPTITDDIPAREFIDLFERTTGARYGGSPSGSLPKLHDVIGDALAEGIGQIAGLRVGGALAAAACFITWENRSILLKSANDRAGQEAQAMFHLTDRWIAQHAGSGRILDFAGSNSPGVARFNAGFGAVQSTYFRYRLNRLPWPFRHLRT